MASLYWLKVRRATGCTGPAPMLCSHTSQSNGIAPDLAGAVCSSVCPFRSEAVRSGAMPPLRSLGAHTGTTVSLKSI